MSPTTVQTVLETSIQTVLSGHQLLGTGDSIGVHMTPNWHMLPLTFTAHCTLHTVHYTLHTTHCIVHTAHYTLHTSHYTMQGSHFTLKTSIYTLHTAHCTLHTARCKLHTAHCTLHTYPLVCGRFLGPTVLTQGYHWSLPCTALPCSAVQCTSLHCTALHYTALQCTAHCIVWSWHWELPKSGDCLTWNNLLTGGCRVVQLFTVNCSV